MDGPDAPTAAVPTSASSSVSPPLSAALPEPAAESRSPAALCLTALPVSIVAMCVSYLSKTAAVEVARASRWFRHVWLQLSSACPRFLFHPVDAASATRAADYYMSHRHCIRHLFATIDPGSDEFELHFLRTLAHMLSAPAPTPGPSATDTPPISSGATVGIPLTPIYLRGQAASSEAGDTVCGEEAFRTVHIRLPVRYHMLPPIMMSKPALRALDLVVPRATKISCDTLNLACSVGQALREVGVARLAWLDIQGTLSRAADVLLLSDHCPMLTQLRCGMWAEVIPAAYRLAPRLRVLDLSAYFVFDTEAACEFARKLELCTSITTTVNVSLAMLLAPVVERLGIDFTYPDGDPEDEEEVDEEEEDEEEEETEDNGDEEEDEPAAIVPVERAVAEARAPTSSSPLPVSTPRTLPTPTAVAPADRVIVSSTLHTLCFSHAYLDSFFFDYWTQHLGALPVSLTVIEFANCTVCSGNFWTKLAAWTSVRSIVFVDMPCSPRVCTRLRAACPWITVSSR